MIFLVEAVISRSCIAQLGVGQLPRGSPGGIDDVHGFEAWQSGEPLKDLHHKLQYT